MGHRLGRRPSVVLGCVCAPDARAYTVSTIVTDGCREALTLGAAGRPRGVASRRRPCRRGADAPIVADLPFELEPDARELGAVSLLLGVRDNDLKGRGSTDLQALALIHGDPTTQDEHCLRNLEDEEPDGTSPAIASRGHKLLTEALGTFVLAVLLDEEG
jgi:hypothetical protein